MGASLRGTISCSSLERRALSRIERGGGSAACDPPPQRPPHVCVIIVNASMTSPRHPEVWLRGPVSAIPPLLQPVAHSLLQCREELQAALERLTPEQIWTCPAGAASVG